MIVVKNARFTTDNKKVECKMDYYVLVNGVPENRPRVAIGEASCAPEDKFVFKTGMDYAYDRAYAKAVEVAKQLNCPDMRFVCVKSNSDFKSGNIYPVHYDNFGHSYVLDDDSDRRPTGYAHINLDTFMAFMRDCHMIRLED